MEAPEQLLKRIEALEKQLSLNTDILEIQRLQCIYGFYIDCRLWRELADLFCEDRPSIEIGQRGSYVGRERIQRFLAHVLGSGRRGLLKNEIINHLQLQPVVTVDEDGQHARMRSRAVVQGSSPPGGSTLLYAEGVYENEYVRENGAWKIKRLWWVPTFYFQVPGFDKAVFQTPPPDTQLPPDAPSAAPDAALGRGFPPFHYPHPFTGSVVTSPSADTDPGDDP